MFRRTATVVFLTASLAQAEELTFERHVRPILKAACFQCHGEEDKPKAKLDARLPSLMVKGGTSGPAIVPGKPDESLLWEKIAADEMPEGPRKLTWEQKATIREWIAQGARTARPEPKNPDDLRITEEERTYWAFQPVRKQAVPPVGAGNPIDGFILRTLNEKGLKPNPIADKRTLIRRATFDLTGLPPSPAEVEAFLKDDSADAYGRLIDRLLASPQYGEHWARHWLDVAGYAESDGVTNLDKVRPHAWRYRDYVVSAFNLDKPFHEFIIEQLAGDELVTKRPLKDLSPRDVERLTATGFLRMAPDATDTENTPVERNNTVAETMKIVGSAFLGLTVGCAQCHDHRYDLIAITDYYRLRAVFDPAFDLNRWQTPSARLINLTPPETVNQRDEIEAKAKAIEKQIRDDEIKRENEIFEVEILKIPEADRAAAREAFFAEKKSAAQQALLNKYVRLRIRHTIQLFDPKAYAEFKKRRADVAKLRDTKPPEQFLPILTEPAGPAPESFVFARGDHEAKRQKVAPGELTVLALQRPTADIPPKTGDGPTTGRRLAYARLLTDGTHPLTARVAVNRIWMHHFGRGIVSTPGDFGAFGERPTHPELLDWLAADFVEHGWKVKRLQKLIMTSEAYRRTATRAPELQAADPDNKLLARASVRRLTAEQLRDAILSVNGKLRLELGGPSVPVAEDVDGMPVLGTRKLNEGLFAGVEPVGEQEYRRSLYIQVRRKMPLPMMEAFDLPVMKPNCDARRCTTVAPQSLLFLNNEFIVRQAGVLADRLLASPGTLEERVRGAWGLLFVVPPTAAELEASLAYLVEQTENFRKQAASKKEDPAKLAVASLCQVLLGSNRFLYVD
jgi:hypothetical protein